MVRYSTLVKQYGNPKNSVSVSAEEYTLASKEGRIMTVFDDGVALIGGHRMVNVSNRLVFPKMSEKYIGESVIGY